MNETTSELRRTSRNAAATVGELREFLAEMKGKSPSEMLGAVASSKLGKSLVQATAGVAAAIVVFTVVPFAIGAMSGGAGGGEAGGSEPAPGAPDPVTPAAVETPPEPSLDPDQQAADALGIGDTKDAPLSVNPLEGGTDDILDDLN